MSEEALSLNEEQAVANNATPEATSQPEVSTPNFIDSLPEDLRGNASLQDFKDVGALAKSYVNAQQMLGSSVRIPGEDASQEAKDEFYAKLSNIPGITRLPNPEDKAAMDAFYNSLGRPEEATGYTLNAPEGVSVNEAKRDEFLQKAHELGLTNDQVQKLAEYELSIHQQQQEAMMSARDQAAEQLREQWGHEYSNRLAGAKEVAKIYSEKYPAAMQEILEGPMANNPAVISMMAELAKTFVESGHAGAATIPNYGVSAEEAREQIAEIYGNKSHAYWDPNNAGHQAAVDKVHKLNRIAYSEQGSL